MRSFFMLRKGAWRWIFFKELCAVYIHLGGEKVIRTDELIAIFDIAIDQASKISKQFVDQASENKQVEIIGDEPPKSLVVSKNKIYYSPISSATLKKRAR